MPGQPLTFIDLFAGIGGIRLAFEAHGAECVATSEWDRFARQTYCTIFGEREEDLLGDITEVEADEIPRHDILTAGFPCQPFSLAGVSKKNSLGRAHGFDDPTQGTLFFDVKRVLLAHRPQAFLLENVKNLRGHDRGRTFKVITDSLTDAGYLFSDRIIDAARVVPQHRERVFIVGFHRDWLRKGKADLDWERFWAGVDRELLEQADVQRRRYGVEPESPWPRVGPVLEPHSSVDPRFTLTDKLWAYLRAYREKHEKKGNGFGYSLVMPDDPYTRTISARYHKDGSEALVGRQPEENPRRLTPLECLRLQGFPADLEPLYRSRDVQPVSDTQAYRQFGNSVAVPVVSAIASELTACLRSERSYFTRVFRRSPASSHQRQVTLALQDDKPARDDATRSQAHVASALQASP